MPAPLLSVLTPRVRALFPLIERGVLSGLSTRSINDAIRAATGTGIRRQVLLDVRRAVLGVARASSALKSIRKDRVPNPDRLEAALTKIRDRFSFKVKLTGLDTITGEERSMFVTISSPVPLSAEELEDLGAATATTGTSGPDFVVLSAALESGVRAGALGSIL